MFPRLPARATCVADRDFVSGTQKMFLILFRYIFCPQQMFPSLRSSRNIMGNNVPATTCPRLPGPLGLHLQMLASFTDITALFNNMRTLKFKSRSTNAFQSNVRRLLLAYDYCRAVLRCLNCAQRFDYRALGSSRRLGGAAEHLIDGSEKRICRLSFEF